MKRGRKGKARPQTVHSTEVWKEAKNYKGERSVMVSEGEREIHGGTQSEKRARGQRPKRTSTNASTKSPYRSYTRRSPAKLEAV